MRVLIACEFSNRIRNAFLDRGHDAYSCDLMRGIQEPYDKHYEQDVTPLLDYNWDLVIAHPPCTYLCNSGVRWMKTDPEREEKMLHGILFFLTCLQAKAKRLCVENPIMHSYAKKYISLKYSQIIQPYQFGIYERKATCLWLRGLPLLKTTNLIDIKPCKQSIHHEKPSPMRGYIRSMTPALIAEAMADQWG